MPGSLAQAEGLASSAVESYTTQLWDAGIVAPFGALAIILIRRAR